MPYNNSHTLPSYAAKNSNGPSLRLFVNILIIIDYQFQQRCVQSCISTKQIRSNLNQTTIVENESMCTGKEPEFRTQKPWERRKSVSSSSRSILFYRFWRSLSNRCLYPFTKVMILQNSGVGSPIYFPCWVKGPNVTANWSSLDQDLMASV